MRWSIAAAGGEGAAWAVPLDSFAELDAVGRLRLLMRQSTEETLAADVDALLLPALLQLPPEERTEALQRCPVLSYPHLESSTSVSNERATMVVSMSSVSLRSSQCVAADIVGWPVLCLCAASDETPKTPAGCSSTRASTDWRGRRPS